MPDVLPHRLPDVAEPLYDGLEATIVLHRKLEVMVLVEEQQAFITCLFTGTEEA